MIQKEKIILGIDPGTTIMGYGLIRVMQKEPSMIALGIIDLKKISDPYLKLKTIFERVVSLIDQYHPDELAVEAPFYGKNVQSMLKLGRAQGVAIAAALSRSVPIFEYAPRKIKMSITGRGNASKEQVALLLQKLLKIKELPPELDATDGLAAALCHFYQANTIISPKNYNSWKDFIHKNPGRVKK
ncbi:MAG: crossover junction endodeoxyribonuclease RuvC [Bacteroidales bacterium]|jgi:crossover junction endodeoxyribonuclease RuvC|nr:crossover junction endodeoxyribonuclease RuvC [Bacteroidales bacterium]